MYSKEQIQSIVQGTDLVSLIGGNIQLKKAGKNYLGLCPFHQEKTPSFHVDDVKNFYHCFGCGKHGDALQFLIEYNNLSFLEALEQLAIHQGVLLKQNKNNFQPIRKILEIAQEFFKEKAQILPVDAKKYFQTRKLQPESIKKFEIGYAPNNWDGLKNILPKNSLAEAEQVGLLRKSEKTGNYYDFFRDRIMFPFRNIQGALVGFAGRSIGEKNLPKYLNSPEFELFQKNSFFYGLFQAKEAIKKKKRIIIVEGYIDVIRMSEQGFAETVAVAGTAITSKHIYTLRQKGVEIFFLFDGDTAGTRAAIKAGAMALSCGLDVKIVLLPKESDPDSFLRESSSKQLENLLQTAENVFSYLLKTKQVQYQKANGLVEKEKILEELIQIGNSIESEKRKNIFFAEVSKHFGISRQLFDSQKLTQNFTTTPVEKKEEMLETMETKLIQAALLELKYFSLIKKYLKSSDFQNHTIQKFLQRLFFMNEDLQSIKFSVLLQVFRDDKKITNFLLSCTKNVSLKQPQGQLEQWIYEIKKKSIYRHYDAIYTATKQKETWQECKKQIKEIEHLSANPVYQRNAHFTTLLNEKI